MVQRNSQRPAPVAAKRPPPPEEEDEFAEAGTLVIDAALELQGELPDDGGGERVQFLKLAQGQNFLRFLPPKVGDKVPWVFTWQHGWGSGSNYRTVNCPNLMSRPPKPCPICDERGRLLQSTRDADKKSAAALKPKLRVIAEVANLTNDEETAKGVQLYAYGRQINDALAGILSAGKMGGDFTHKTTGFPILIVREGEGVDTNYPTVSATPDRGPIEAEWLSMRHDLDRFRRLPTREEMEGALKGLGLRGSASMSKAASPRRGSVADDMNDVDDVDADAYEAQSAPPSKRAHQPPRR